ncbi:unnamed protein product [Polarella glacialis]|uniref:Uncharacterized protein n=1 Tax=Polarella glacialis TaxID=89957 RepID=A0A813KD14_POLGL|nr:unnamed protein product [Polarella glacialis]
MTTLEEGVVILRLQSPKGNPVQGILLLLLLLLLILFMLFLLLFLLTPVQGLAKSIRLAWRPQRWQSSKNTFVQQTNNSTNNNKPTTKQPWNSNVVHSIGLASTEMPVVGRNSD